MKKVKLIGLILAVALLVPVLTSCSESSVTTATTDISDTATYSTPPIITPVVITKPVPVPVPNPDPKIIIVPAPHPVPVSHPVPPPPPPRPIWHWPWHHP
jgi:hypothetical protein